jgi:TM2 domain-containing membrane protein YozV
MSSEFTSPGGLPPLPPAPPVTPYTRPKKQPGVAVLLSLCPGLGQVYNGQPAKALVFFFLFVGCIYAANEIHPMPFVFGIFFTYLWNLVDAYKSASAISSRASGRGEVEEEGFESPAWGATLIAFGMLLLLNNLGWLRLAALQRWWPILLVAAGVGMLVNSLRRRSNGGSGL